MRRRIRASLRGTGTSAAVVMKAASGSMDTHRHQDRREAHPDFASAAVVAVREWEYTQTLLNCQPVGSGHDHHGKFQDGSAAASATGAAALEPATHLSGVCDVGTSHTPRPG